MQKIYTQHFSGKYRTIKNIVSSFLLFIYMVSAWIPYDRGYGLPNQALFIDLPQRKAYIFGIIIWPEELYYLTFSLILAAIGLFICTSLFGRLWCGYTCPHSTMVDVFMFFERLIQGDRNARMRLDEQSMSGEKFIKKSLTHIVWLLLGFLFAFGWVGYFYEVRFLWNDLIHLSISKNGLIWLFALTLTTYLFGGFLREKVCMHMCPYGRFQSGLVDSNTILVTYHTWRGEPRGKGESHGDCIDCNRCVIACPMGIDIRNGLQMPCIGCGLCIDACDEVMTKMNRPKGLIEYTSSNIAMKLQESWNHQRIKKIIFSPKVLLYCGVFSIVSCVFVASLIMKSFFIFKVDKINSPLFTITPDGNIRNAYIINIMNKTTLPQKNLCLFTQGLNGALISLQAISGEYKEKECFDLNPGKTLESQVFVLLKNKPQEVSHVNFNFILNNDKTVQAKETSAFYVSK